MTRRAWVVAGALVAVVAAAVGVVVVAAGADRATPAAQEPPANTGTVERGALSNTVSQAGTLTYRARSDGAPYAVVDRAGGIYTRLPAAGDRIDCGDVLYRVSNRPVVLLCGLTPAYRPLSEGDSGPDVAELNANLVELGYADRTARGPSDRFGAETASALAELQSKLGERRTGSLDLGRAVFLPGPLRIAEVTVELGASARPGERVMSATSDVPEVQVALDPSRQGEVRRGDRARITLPGNRSTTGRVERLGRVAQAGHGDDAAAAAIPAYVSLDHPGRARGLDRAPVRVEIATRGVRSALSVPVTAIAGTTGGGFAVEIVRGGGRRDLVAVTLGVFDTARGRVQIDGDVREGDRVVVGSS